MTQPLAAYPYDSRSVTDAGTTLRDYIAICAMQALITVGSPQVTTVVTRAYEYADAMMVARSPT